MEISILEWVGYVASVIIAFSMAMNSIVKFRVINLVGASLFSTYGFLIGSFPVGFLNGFILIVDIYYLVAIFSKKEVFEILEVRNDNKYLVRFLSFYNKDIQNYFPGFSYKPELNTVSFITLRNMAVAGVFLAHRVNESTLKVGLDYVVPEYRDFKNGRFVYFNLRNKFIEAGYTKVVAGKSSVNHEKYLKKLGFEQNSEGMLEKILVKNPT
jgi:hypothetical protein